MLELALLASDNHTASCWAWRCLGGMVSCLEGARLKALALQLAIAGVLEPTCLSPDNRPSANDLAVILLAAAESPAMAAAANQTRRDAVVKGKAYHALNTNRLVGSPGWYSLLRRTGISNGAGRCLVMRMQTAGKSVLLVLLNASANAGRTLDALNVTRWLAELAPLKTLPLVDLETRGRRALRVPQCASRLTKLA